MSDNILNDNVHGYPPLNLDECQNLSTSDLDPSKAKKVLGDVILCELLDESGDGLVQRGGILVKEDMGSRLWRRAKVIKVGSQCKDVSAGDVVVYPSDRGIKMIGVDKKKYLFLNESRIFYVEG
jgi:co-chaperonin GroES (HSP10)